jgi:hypothetical protein
MRPHRMPEAMLDLKELARTALELDDVLRGFSNPTPAIL